MVIPFILNLEPAIGYVSYKDKAVDATLGQTNAAGTPALAPYPTASIVAGDVFLLLVSSKYPTDTNPATPSGWNTITGGQGTGGTQPAVTAGDKGTTTSTVFYKEATGSETGTVSITLNGAQSGRMLGATMMQFSKNGTLGIAATNGSLNTVTSTSLSIPMSSNPGFAAGDEIAILFTANTDAFNYSGFSLSIPGCTVDTITMFEQPWTAGQDAETVYGYTKVLTGTSAGNATLSMTSSGFVAETGIGDGGPEGSAVLVRMRGVVSGGGGTTYPVDVTEFGSADSTQGAQVIFISSVSEAATASDSESSQVVYIAAQSEAGSATDSQSASNVGVASLTEAASASTTQGATVISSASVSEAATATDSSTWGLLISASITESASATDLVDRSVTSTATVTETAAASTVQGAAYVTAGSISEAANATDSPNRTFVTASSITEAASASDLNLATLQDEELFIETANAQTTQGATVVYAANIIESASATDFSSTGAAPTAASITESANATTTQNGLLVRAGIMVENANAVDLSNAVVIIGAGVIEAASADDNISATYITTAGVLEAANAQSEQRDADVPLQETGICRKSRVSVFAGSSTVNSFERRGKVNTIERESLVT